MPRLYLIIASLAIEYTAFLLILFNQRRLAVTIFCALDKHSAIIYFEIVLAVTYLLANLLVLFLARHDFTHSALNKKEHFILSAVFVYVIFFIFMLYLPAIMWLRVGMFVAVSLWFIYFYIKERLLAMFYLLKIVRSYQLYKSFGKIFFTVFSISLLLANIIHGATDFLFETSSRIVGSFSPLLIFMIAVHLWGKRLTIRIDDASIQRMDMVIRTISNNFSLQLFRLIINMTIGGFLVEWYFYTPMLVGIRSGWNNTSIDMLTVGMNFIAILLIFQLPRWINLINVKTVLISLIILFVACDILLDVLPNYHYLIMTAFFIMTICFNQIIQSANKIVHYRIHQLSSNTFFLIWGSGIGIILFCFVYSVINNLLSFNIINASRSAISDYSLVVLAISSIVATVKIANPEQI